jgi:hypothetical protein
MSQPSEDRSPEPTQVPKMAQVLPFERPQSELQRAVQLRAQESMARQRARASIRPNPLRRIAAFALALIPVALMFIAVDGLLRVFHHMNDLYSTPAGTESASAAEEPQVEAEPGVVLLQVPKDVAPAPPPAQTR